MSNEKVLLETKNLKKYFKVKKGMLHAVDDVTLSIAEGKTLGLVGESGCGKSTIGRTILKLTEPTDGRIIFNGTDITDFSVKQMKPLRKDMQIIFQDPYSSIDPRKSVSQIIAEPLLIARSLSKAEINEKVRDIMDTVGLAQRLYDSYPHELDGGRRQRIGVARALIQDPKLVVCDEPVSALDVSIQAQILNLLMDLQEQRNLSYLFITHDMSVVRHISDDIMVMYLGRSVEKSGYSDLFIHPLHPYTKALLAAIPIAKSEMRKKHLEVIRGEVTNPIDPKPCCRFAPRCSFATEQCFSEEPILKEVRTGHFVACFHPLEK